MYRADLLHRAAGRPTPEGPTQVSFIMEFARTPGTRPATLVARPPGQAAREETLMEVTRDLAAAALLIRRRDA